MGAKEIMGAVDEDINMYLRRGEKFDICELVDSFNLDEGRRPVVEQYVVGVYDLYLKADGELRKNTKKVRNLTRVIGLVTFPAFGGVVGALAGYLFEGPNGAEKYAEGCATLGLLGEAFFHPTASFLAGKYRDAVTQSCEILRARYRNETLTKLVDFE